MLELALEQLPRPMKSRLDRTGGEAQDARDLFILQFLDLFQDKRSPVLLRERADRIAQDLAALLAQDLLARPEAPVRNLELRRILVPGGGASPDIVVEDLAAAFTEPHF